MGQGDGPRRVAGREIVKGLTLAGVAWWVPLAGRPGWAEEGKESAARGEGTPVKYRTVAIEHPGKLEGCFERLARDGMPSSNQTSRACIGSVEHRQPAVLAGTPSLVVVASPQRIAAATFRRAGRAPDPIHQSAASCDLRSSLEVRRRETIIQTREGKEQVFMNSRVAGIVAGFVVFAGMLVGLARPAAAWIISGALQCDYDTHESITFDALAPIDVPQSFLDWVKGHVDDPDYPWDDAGDIAHFTADVHNPCPAPNYCPCIGWECYFSMWDSEMYHITDLRDDSVAYLASGSCGDLANELGHLFHLIQDFYAHSSWANGYSGDFSEPICQGQDCHPYSSFVAQLGQGVEIYPCWHNAGSEHWTSYDCPDGQYHNLAARMAKRATEREWRIFEENVFASYAANTAVEMFAHCGAMAFEVEGVFVDDFSLFTLVPGETGNIHWAYIGMPPNDAIEIWLFRGSEGLGTVYLPGQGVPGRDSQYDWVVGSYYNSSGQRIELAADDNIEYSIKLYSPATSRWSDTDYHFKLGSVEITSPSQPPPNQSVFYLQRGEPFDIKWSYSGFDSDYNVVSMLLYQNSSTFLGYILNNPADNWYPEDDVRLYDEEFQWTVGRKCAPSGSLLGPGSNYSIEMAFFNERYTFNSVEFVIYDNFVVTAPQAGASWEEGDVQTIAWDLDPDALAPRGEATLALYTPGEGGVKIGNIADVWIDAKSYAWTVGYLASVGGTGAGGWVPEEDLPGEYVVRLEGIALSGKHSSGTFTMLDSGIGGLPGSPCTAGFQCTSDICLNGTCTGCGDDRCRSEEGESCSTCAADCGACSYCGNGTCGGGETCATCPQDCGACPSCGNGICGSAETCSSCPQDCGACPSCGDGACGSGETCATCPQDCGACSSCGNGICGSGETCSNCPQDCGACPVCGDGSCNGSETCTTCQLDCCPNAVCTPGQIQHASCGFCGEGTRQRTCDSTGQWGYWGACIGQGCTPGNQQEQDCGGCGTRTRICSSTCTWNAWSPCENDFCNLQEDKSFETGTGWDYGNHNQAWPGSSIWRYTTGTAEPRTGSYALALSNQAYAYPRTDFIAAGPGSHTVAAWLRGEMSESSKGGWALRVLFFDSNKQALSPSSATAAGCSGSFTCLTDSWTRKSGTVTAPAGTAYVKIAPYFSLAGGWVAYDDVELDGQALSVATHGVDGGFETATGWSWSTYDAFPASSVWRGTWGTAEPRTGSRALALSNHAYATPQTGLFAASPGTHTLSVWAKGELETSTAGGWQLRAYFYDSSQTQLSYQVAAGCYGGGSACTYTSWTQKSGTVAAPSGTAYMLVQILFYMADGWFAFDDVALDGQVLNPSTHGADGGFETATGWSLNKNASWPATALRRWNTSPVVHSGSNGLYVGNHAYAHPDSDFEPVTPGAPGVYKVSAWTRGEMNESSRAGWLIRAYFYDSNMAELSWQNVSSCNGAASCLSTTWTQKSGEVTAPAGTAYMKIQLYFYDAGGWAAIDDVEILALYCPGTECY